MDDIPNDENGHVLKRMREGGDSLSRPRIIEFQFVFPERPGSLDFARVVTEKQFEICLSYYEECSCWQAEVKVYMLPTHSEITRIELDLSERAAEFDGTPDGWCCLRINDTNTEEA